MSKRIVVVGTGYVGLTSGACFAHLGHRVTCVDSDEEKLKRIASGSLPIYEPGLEDIVRSGLSNGRLVMSSSLADAVALADFVFLCLPTPPAADGSADLTVLTAVAKELGPLLPLGAIVVNKSTVPVRSSRLVEESLGGGHRVVSNPEFLREGSAVQDFLAPDRIVIGSDQQSTGQKVAELYETLGAEIVLTDPESAETIKYAANSFLATKISFVNEIARFCELIGANIDEVLRGLSHDVRIGSTYLSPGPGWGGSCFPKDTRALVASARSLGLAMRVVESAIASNSEHIDHAVNTIRSEAELYEKPTVALLGLSFKAHTDDVRDSPAVQIAMALRSEGHDMRVYDPMARGPETLDHVRVSSLREALDGAHVAGILTEWPEFEEMEPASVRTLMAGISIFDARYVVDVPRYEAVGFRVRRLG